MPGFQLVLLFLSICLTTAGVSTQWRGVAATRCVESTKLLYGGPG